MVALTLNMEVGFLPGRLASCLPDQPSLCRILLFPNNVAEAKTSLYILHIRFDSIDRLL